ncbi:hypothetical protein FQI89_24415 [Escherichia coli]|nr:hypothetical protein [Escherichia coli]
MEKRQRRILFSFILDLSAIHLVILDLSAIHLVILEQVTPAAASRQERSDRVSEEASFHRLQHFALTPHS